MMFLAQIVMIVRFRWENTRQYVTVISEDVLELCVVYCFNKYRQVCLFRRTQTAAHTGAYKIQRH